MRHNLKSANHAYCARERSGFQAVGLNMLDMGFIRAMGFKDDEFRIPDVLKAREGEVPEFDKSQ